MLSLGVDINARDKWGGNALYYAKKNQDRWLKDKEILLKALPEFKLKGVKIYEDGVKEYERRTKVVQEIDEAIQILLKHGAEEYTDVSQPTYSD